MARPQLSRPVLVIRPQWQIETQEAVSSEGGWPLYLQRFAERLKA